MSGRLGADLDRIRGLSFLSAGLAAHFLGISSAEQASRDPLRGGLYENLLIVEMMKERLNRGLTPHMFFYRDTHGNEVDLVLRGRQKLFPVEIKSRATFTEEYLRGIESFRKTVGTRATAGVVLYNGEQKFEIRGTKVLNPFLHKGLSEVALA